MYLGGGCFGHILFDTLFGYNWDSVFNKKKRKRVVNKLFLKNEKKTQDGIVKFVMFLYM